MRKEKKKKKKSKRICTKVHVCKVDLLDLFLHHQLTLVEIKKGQFGLKPGWYWVDGYNEREENIVLNQNAWPFSAISFFMDTKMKDALIKK